MCTASVCIWGAALITITLLSQLSLSTRLLFAVLFACRLQGVCSRAQEHSHKWFGKHVLLTQRARRYAGKLARSRNGVRLLQPKKNEQAWRRICGERECVRHKYSRILPVLPVACRDSASHHPCHGAYRQAARVTVFPREYHCQQKKIHDSFSGSSSTGE